MRLAWLMAAAGGMALAALMAGAGGIVRKPEEPTAATTPEAPAIAEHRERSTAPETFEARRIGPALVAPPPIDPTKLVRMDPRAPLSDLALALPPEQGVSEKALLYRPVATAAGRLEADGHSIALQGVETVEPDMTCRAADGSSWPCGMVARTAFRNWLRGRAVACTVAEPPAEETVVTDCSLGDKDVALWLVENGFARAEPDGRYAEAGEMAETAQRGIFGPGPVR